MGTIVKQEIVDMKYLIIAIALFGLVLENAQAQSMGDCISFLFNPECAVDDQQLGNCLSGLQSSCVAQLTSDSTFDDIRYCLRQLVLPLIEGR